MAKPKIVKKWSAKSLPAARKAGRFRDLANVTQTAPTPKITIASAQRASIDPASRAYTTILGLPTAGTAEIVETVRKGLPFGAFERFIANTSLSSADAAVLVNIPSRTLTRRKQEGRLNPDESDRLLRASRILGRAFELFEGDRDQARGWLTRPQRALGGAKPLDVASTEVGALAVERLIDQLEQGVFV
jgi:putative toxin-antitoxin system antitoxin component (TIGR02293 family)